jgi:hypothetical protein
LSHQPLIASMDILVAGYLSIPEVFKPALLKELIMAKQSECVYSLLEYLKFLTVYLLFLFT